MATRTETLIKNVTKRCDTKQPSGLQIARNGNKFMFAWKISGSDYGQGQELEYRFNGGKYQSIVVGKKTTSASVTFTENDYFPVTDKHLRSVEFRVRGRRSDYTKDSSAKEVARTKSGSDTIIIKEITRTHYVHAWSEWGTKAFDLSEPNKPSVSSALSGEFENVCTFSWNANASATGTKHFKRVKWQSIIVKDCNESDGSKLTWKSGNVGWLTDTGGNTGSRTITEDTNRIAGKSYTRWFRVKAQGARGDSDDWSYSKHVYSKPYGAKIVKTDVDAVKGTTYNAAVQWTASKGLAHPIDKVVVEYAIATPSVGLKCPSGASFTEGAVVKDTSEKDKVQFSIDDRLDLDECLYVRVNTYHDSHITYSTPALAEAGKLSPPSNLEFTPTTGYAGVVSADNISAVPDSFIVIVLGRKGKKDVIVGIIKSGASSCNVVCPSWEGLTYSFKAYAAQGSYKKTDTTDGTTRYSVTANMESDVISLAGSALPKAPTLSVSDQGGGRAKLTWNKSWSDADSVDISWADRESAWMSTDGPEVYSIDHMATSWYVDGLELGRTWFFRVRLKSSDGMTDWSEIAPVSGMKRGLKLSYAPEKPVLSVSPGVIAEGGNTVLSWTYSCRDGSPQTYASIEAVEYDYDPADASIYLDYYQTADTQIVSGKTYYELVNGEYLEVETPDVDDIESYYEAVVHTEEIGGEEVTPLDPNITYYEYVGGEYVEVTDPEYEDIGDYYELTERSLGEIAHTEAAQSLSLYADNWEAGNDYALRVRVTSGNGMVSAWSDVVSVSVVQPLTAVITSTSLEEITIDSEQVLSLTEMPLTATVTGAGAGGKTSLVVQRAESYYLERPDGGVFNGYEGEIVASVSIDGEGQLEVTNDILTGAVDDGARYRLIATVRDTFGQSASASIDFEVHWERQAQMPDALCEVLEDGAVKITPSAPVGYLVEDDVCDIYRLSADMPELIVKDAEFGTAYVDPYPTIGEFGGHRIVYRTSNGDYITEDNNFAWVDTDISYDDLYESEDSIINFGGSEIRLKYDVDLSNQWEKDFVQTKYLGGSIQGDWSAGVRRSATVTAATINIIDQDKLRAIRQLAEYEGVCRIRTLDGSNYPCDIQVSESRTSDKHNVIAAFNFTINRVETAVLDGMTYDKWVEEHSAEEEESE